MRRCWGRRAGGTRARPRHHLPADESPPAVHLGSLGVGHAGGGPPQNRPTSVLWEQSGLTEPQVPAADTVLAGRMCDMQAPTGCAAGGQLLRSGWPANAPAHPHTVRAVLQAILGAQAADIIHPHGASAGAKVRRPHGEAGGGQAQLPAGQGGAGRSAGLVSRCCSSRERMWALANRMAAPQHSTVPQPKSQPQPAPTCRPRRRRGGRSGWRTRCPISHPPKFPISQRCPRGPPGRPPR